MMAAGAAQKRWEAPTADAGLCADLCTTLYQQIKKDHVNTLFSFPWMSSCLISALIVKGFFAVPSPACSCIRAFDADEPGAGWMLRWPSR